MKDRTKTPHFVSNAQYSENISKTIDGLKKRRKAEKDSVTGQAALSPWEADRSRPPPAPAPKDPAAQVFCNPNRESSSRILGKTPAFQDGVRLGSSLLSRRKRKAGRGFCTGEEDCQQSRWSISSRLGRVRESEWHIASNTRIALIPLCLIPESSQIRWQIVPLGQIPNGTILHKGH